MKWLVYYKSKKYLFKLLLTIMLSLIFVLTAVSVTNSIILERSMNRMQHDSNLKVLAHMNYNLSYMNLIISNLANSIYQDNQIIPLMYGNVPKMDWIRGYQKMYSQVEISPFLHSITIYNSLTDQFYGTATDYFVNGEATRKKIRQWLFNPNHPIPKAQLIPMSLSNNHGEVDVFSIVVSDSLQYYKMGESCIILNIRSDWVYEGLKKINHVNEQETGTILIMDQEGFVYTNESVLNGLKNQELRQHILSDQSVNHNQEGYIIGDIDGKKSIVTYMSAGIRNWTIINIQSYDQVMAEITGTMGKSIYWSGFFLVVSIILSFWVSSKLYRPIENMLARTKSSRFDESHQATGKRKDELSAMSDEFVRLSTKLNEISTEQIVKKYHLRRFLTDSTMFTQQDMLDIISKNELAISVNNELLVCVLAIDHYTDYHKQTSHSKKKLYNFAIVNIANEIISKEFNCETVDIRGDHFALIISKRMDELSCDHLEQLLREIQETITRYYGLSLTCGMSEQIYGLHRLSDMYSQALQNTLYRMVYGTQTIVTPIRVRENMWNDQFAVPAILERKLSEALKKGNIYEAKTELNAVFDVISTFHHNHILRAVLNIAWLIEGAANEILNNRFVKTNANYGNLNQVLQEKETLEEMHGVLAAFCSDICENQKPAHDERNAAMVEAIKELIEQKYQDINLCQQSVADAVQLSSAYVGKIFKNCTDITIKEYINEVRLKRAKQLLEKGNKSIAEIMDKCGYANPSYFFRLFKKNFGSTPKEYRIKRLMTHDAG